MLLRATATRSQDGMSRRAAPGGPSKPPIALIFASSVLPKPRLGLACAPHPQADRQRGTEMSAGSVQNKRLQVDLTEQASMADVVQRYEIHRCALTIDGSGVATTIRSLAAAPPWRQSRPRPVAHFPACRSRRRATAAARRVADLHHSAAPVCIRQVSLHTRGRRGPTLAVLRKRGRGRFKGAAGSGELK